MQKLKVDRLGRRGQLMGCISSGVSGSDGDESAK